MPEAKNVHVDAVLTRYSQQYQNEPFIAAEALPFLKVVKRSDIWFVYDKDERFTRRDSKSGPRSKGNEIDFNITEDNYSVKGYELRDFVSNVEKSNQDQPLDVRRDAADLIMELLMLDYEFRVSTLVQTDATYPAANRRTLAGTDQWTDKTNATPVDDILLGLDTAFMRPNTIIFGAESWRSFRTHPQVLDAVKGSTRHQTAGGGIAMREDVAALFEVGKVLVGRSRHNVARRGQSASYSRLWLDNCILLHLNPNPTPRSITFGCTVTNKLPLTRSWEVPDRGEEGGEMISTAWTADEKIKAADLGYFIKDTNA